MEQPAPPKADAKPNSWLWGLLSDDPLEGRRSRRLRERDGRAAAETSDQEVTRPALRSRTFTIEVRPERRHAFVDLTDELRKAIIDSGVAEGCAVAFCAHTTSALLINEWEEGALEDFRRRLEALVPTDSYFAHDDLQRRTQDLQQGHERANGQAHVTQMLLGGSSHAIPVSAGEPMLGQWQRLLLLELDEPKDRSVIFHVFGS